ncbi:MAG: SsrA-binding protein SmpB [Clostridia bacterium]|nr:SsrA-binding protein SmpB [Clostridia bacterium]
MIRKNKKTVCQNRKAYHDFFVNDMFEAGIELFGTEVKSVRQGQVNLRDSFCKIEKGELIAYGIRISPYEKGNIYNRDPLRPKRLLMHKREINRLFGQVSQKGYTLIPLSLYFSDSRVKVELGLCTGKKLYDKREDDARRDADREIEKAVKEKKYD